MFTGITREICEQAWQIVEPAIAKAAELGVIAGYQGNIVVLDPVADDGSILFTTAGKNEPEAKPFITMGASSTLKGLVVFYPEQTEKIIPYPWCICGVGDNCFCQHFAPRNSRRGGRECAAPPAGGCRHVVGCRAGAG